ncbi:MAG: hypothetical protein JNM94_00605 [Phycisphaerae bacterium]|nr:hypothetical protein [Phycisphaerae bacterium]
MMCRLIACVVVSATVLSGVELSMLGPLASLPTASAQVGGSVERVNPAATESWPRSFSNGGNSVVMYQPQVDEWNDHRTIRFRAAIAVTPAGAKGAAYGVLVAEGTTTVDHDANLVLISNVKATPSFPSLSPDEAATCANVVTSMLAARSTLHISLDRVLAYMHDEKPPPSVDISLAPPPIYYSDTPAILLSFVGEPQFKPVPESKALFAVNSNWPLLLDPPSATYYLLYESGWLTTTDPIHGPWTPATETPPSFETIPTDGTWLSIASSVPCQPPATTPKVIATTVPAELIVTNGAPEYSPIPGTGLLYVSNPEQPVFQLMSTGTFYFLAAGRWFSASSLSGPWASASASLPADFARISADGPMGDVLASVPGTSEAKNAVLLAQVPHTATINRDDAKPAVSYLGEPSFTPIAGTTMTYATNTSSAVVFADGAYYCCEQGVWFVAPAATGPWTVCTSVPAVIYTIPPTCPLYNCTYVKVYDVTPTTVVVGYTAGYSGSYVAATGVVMFGAGLAVGALLADNTCWCCSSCYYSYGCCAWYHYGYGYCSGGAAWYGPYGGCGWHGYYNPTTGTWGKAGYAYGPGGEARYREAYNPWTGTYAGHAAASNGYRSWGGSVVSNSDGAWAEGAHTTGPAGVTRGWAQDSAGQSVQGAHAGNTSVAKTGSGDTYASHDGNVYRKDSGGSWEKYNGSDGGWQPVNKPAGNAETARTWQDHDTMSQLNRDSWSRGFGDSSSGSSWQQRGFGGEDRSFSQGSAFRGGGFGGGFGGRFAGGGFHGGFRR